jgi:hypothetical protein
VYKREGEESTHTQHLLTCPYTYTYTYTHRYDRDMLEVAHEGRAKGRKSDIDVATAKKLVTEALDGNR